MTSSSEAGPLAPGDRVCAEADCSTRLSVYNDLDHCSLHTPMVVPRMRGKVNDD